MIQDQPAADAHADQHVRWRPSAEPIAYTSDMADRYGTSARTQRRWMSDGPPVVREYREYALSHPDQARMLVEEHADDYRARIRAKSTAHLVSWYMQLLADDKRAEAEDTCDDMDPDKTWAERSRSSKRDAAVNTAKAAIEEEFQRRGVPTDLVEVAG